MSLNPLCNERASGAKSAQNMYKKNGAGGESGSDNPAIYKVFDAGYIGPHGMWRYLSFSYRGMCCVSPPPPQRQKSGFVWGTGREPKKAKQQEEICFLVIFLIIFDIIFFCIKKNKHM